MRLLDKLKEYTVGDMVNCIFWTGMAMLVIMAILSFIPTTAFCFDCIPGSQCYSGYACPGSCLCVASEPLEPGICVAVSR